MFSSKLMKWAAVGIVASVSLPAIGFARTHKTVQPVSMSAKTASTPVALHATTSRKRVSLTRRTKLSGLRRKHSTLHSRSHKSSKLHSTSRIHRSLSARRKTAA